MPLTRRRISPKKSPFTANKVGSASFTIGVETANVITVAVQLKDEALQPLAVRGVVDWFIASDATGDTIVATAPDAGVVSGTNGWVVTYVTGKYGKAGSEANGTIDVAIGHAAGAKTVYLGIVLPDGSRVMSGVITFV